MRNNLIRRILPLLMILAGLLAASAAQAAPVTPAFGDVSTGNSNILYINYLSSRGIVGGFPDGTYRPGEGLTRAEAAVVLAKAAGLVQSAGPSNFSDVGGHWAAGAINAASSAGLITGYPDSTFRPDAMISRAEGITMFLGLSKQADPGVAMPAFADVSPGHWAARPVAIGLASGMVSLGGSNFFPDSSLTRGDMARMLGVLLTKDPDLSRTGLKITLKVTAGAASVTRGGSGDTEEVTPGADVQVNAGDKIKTAPGCIAQLVFPDGSGMLLEEGAELTVKEARGRSYITADGRPGVAVDWLNLDMDKGSMFGTLAKNYRQGAPSGGAASDNTAAKGIRDLPSVAGLNVWNIRDLLAVGEAGGEVPWWESSSQQAVRVQVDMPWGVAGVRGTTWRIALDDEGDASFSILEGEGELTAGGSTRSVGQLQVVNVPYGAAPGQAAAMSPEEVKAFVQEAVQQWLQERAEDMQSNSQLYVQVDEAAPPSIVEIINQAIEEAVRESQPENNGGNSDNNDDDNNNTGSPYITSVVPGNGAVNVPVNKPIKVYFDGTVAEGNSYNLIKLSYYDSVNEAVYDIAINTDIDNNCLYVVPEDNLMYDTLYTLKIPAGAVQKLSGNGVNIEKIYSFTTRGALASSPWPMLGHDTGHTGLSQYSGPGSPPENEKWTYYTGGNIAASPAVGTDGTIYLVTDSGYLYAVTPEGDDAWDPIYIGSEVRSSPAIREDGTIFVGSNHMLHAYYPSGNFKWDFPLKEDAELSYSSPAIAPDGTVYIGITDESEVGRLYAINPDGSEKWHVDVGTSANCSPAIGPDGNVYMNNSEKVLQGFDPEDGSLLWSYGPEEGVTLGSPAIGAGGIVYMSTDNGSVCAFDPVSRNQKWYVPVDFGLTRDLAMGNNGYIYVGSTSGYLYALDPSDGSQQWTANLSMDNYYRIFAPPTVGSDGTVYIGTEGESSGGYLWALDGETGDEKWYISTDDAINSPVIIGGEGIIYAVANGESGSLIAIGDDITPPVVESTDPEGDSLLNNVNQIYVFFDGEIQAGDNFDGITINDVPIDVENLVIDYDTLYITPETDPMPDGDYQVEIPAGAVEDISGNTLEDYYLFDFTVDSAAPEVISSLVGSTDVPANCQMKITFSEEIQEYDFAQITGLGEYGTDFQCEVSGDTLTIIPLNMLGLGQLYNVLIDYGTVEDLAGNLLATGYSFSFTTSLNAPPELLNTYPTPGGGESVTNYLNVNFTENIQLGANIGGVTVTYNNIDEDTIVEECQFTAADSTLVISRDGPDVFFEPGDYTVTIPFGAVEDTGDPAMPNSYYEFSFTLYDGF